MIKSKLIYIVGLLSLWQGAGGYCARDAWAGPDNDSSYQGVIRKNLELRKTVRGLEIKYRDLENERKVLILHVKELQETRDLTDRVIRDLNDRITKLKEEMAKDPHLSATMESLNRQMNAVIAERDQSRQALESLTETSGRERQALFEESGREREDLLNKNRQLTEDLAETRRMMEAGTRDSDDARKKLEEELNQTKFLYEEKERKLSEQLRAVEARREEALRSLRESEAGPVRPNRGTEKLNRQVRGQAPRIEAMEKDLRRREKESKAALGKVQQERAALEKRLKDARALTRGKETEKRLPQEPSAAPDNHRPPQELKDAAAETKMKNLEASLEKLTLRAAAREEEIDALKEKKSELEQKLVRYIEKMLNMEETVRTHPAMLQRPADDAQGAGARQPGEESPAMSKAQTKKELARQKLNAHYNLALAYDKMEMYKEEEKEYLACLKVDPQDANVHYNLGILYDDKLNMNVKAVEHYKKFLELRPVGEDAQEVKTWILYAQQEQRLGEQTR
jgi:tetratricopeptide (TPR) repeat protein